MNKMKGENHLIILTDEGRAFDKIEHLWQRTLSNRDEGDTPQHKGHLGQPPDQHHTQQETTESVSLKTGGKAGMPALTTLIQHSAGVLVAVAGQGDKGVHIAKEEVTLSLFAGSVHRDPQGPPNAPRTDMNPVK